MSKLTPPDRQDMPFKYPLNAELRHVSQIKTEDRVRKEFNQESLAQLAESIMSLGLLHPSSVDKRGNLIGGERRLRAITEIINSEWIPVTILDVNKADRLELELDENLRRKDFTWQEKCLGVYRLHQHHKRARNKLGKDWRQLDTGHLLGLSSKTHVANCLIIGEALENEDAEICACVNMTAAIDLILRRKEQEANEVQAKRLGQRAKKKSNIPDALVGTTISTTKSGSLGSLDDLDQALSKPTPKPSVILPEASNEPYRFPLFERLLKETDQNMGKNSIMANLAPESVDHIVCDPPYAIEVNVMGLKNVDEIADTHDVEQNIELLAAFIPLAYRALKPGGFLAFWYDNVHWEYLYKLTTKAGFATQRWPIVWCKMHQCRNQSANQNFTKATEFAMICRKGTATLAAKANKNFFLSDGSVERKQYSNPFAKPHDAWAFLLQTIAHPGQTILDPFMGQGSSIRAMINLGFNPLGIEVDEHHYNKCVVDISNLLKELHGNNVILE